MKMANVTRFVLTDNWLLKDFEPGHGEKLCAFNPDHHTGDWIKASVPGVVHLDLMKEGLIPDPFFGLNEKEVVWVEGREWWYRNDFEASSELVSKQKVELCFHGLDTFATVWLNGKKLGQTDNMFIPWRYDVKNLIVDGRNVLAVKFDPPTSVLDALEASKGRMGAAFYTGRVYGRKCQCSFGWDWGPRLPTSGIWKPVEVVAYDLAKIEHVTTKVKSVTLSTAELVLEAEVHCTKYFSAEIAFEVSLNGQRFARTFSKRLVTGKNTVEAHINIADPKLWWPSGYGEQPLYDLKVSVKSGANELDHMSTRFGIRKVELVQKTDEQGKTFIFHINGIPIFCKGANWIPADSILPRVTAKDYEDLLNLAKEAQINMLRVWGGGIYESDVFYELCDEKGIMVWQDFMFACAEYPEEEWFWENVKIEAEEAVRRLRDHPSIVLWCGNNENQWGFYARWWGKKDKFYGETVYHKILPEVCARLDPSRPYWPGSPFGGVDPNSQAEGDRHSWDVWSGWQDYTMYCVDNGRFISEFGFQAPPTMETIESFTKEKDRSPQSEVMEHHNKMVQGTERLFRFLAAHFKVPEDFKSYVLLTQINQGEALKTGIEHWRRRKFMTSGALFWQLNDCWPVASWSVIDYYHRLKPSYYYVKRCFSPLLVSLTKEGESVNAWVTNDTLREFKGKVVLKLQTLRGNILSAAEQEVSIPANSSKMVLSQKLEPSTENAVDRFFTAQLYYGDELLSQNTLFLKRFKHVELPRPKFKVRMEEGANVRSFRVTVSSNVFVKAVYIKLPQNLGRCFYSDNYFDLLPKSERTVFIKTDRKMPLEELKKVLKLRSV